MGKSFASRDSRGPLRAVGRSPTTTATRTIQTAQERVLHLQRIAGNQAVSRLLDGQADLGPVSPDVSRPDFAGLRANATLGADANERGTERFEWSVAQSLGATSQPVSPSRVGEPGGAIGDLAAPQREVPFQLQAAVPHLGGQPLPATIVASLKTGVGFDFSRVRLHTDQRAAASAQAANARAFTIGSHIFFGAREYQPSSRQGRELLAHELAHVSQQSRTPHALRVQRKLRLIGASADINRALTILNAGLFGHSASVDAGGNVQITRTSTQGPPTAQQSSALNYLNTMISDSRSVSVSVTAGSSTLVGSYATGDIDIADIETFGTGRGGTATSTLMHELVEQYQKQARGMAYGGETTGAHAAGMAAEAGVTGATRGPQRMVFGAVNPDGTVSAVVELPYTYPDGTVVTLRMTIVRNQVTGVTRR